MTGFFLLETPSLSQNQQKADSASAILYSIPDLSDSLTQHLLYIVYSEHTNPDSIIKFAKKAYELAQSRNMKDWTYKSLLNIGQGYKSKGQLKKSLNTFLTYLEKAKSESDERREALAYSAIGSVYRVQENYSSALNYYNLGIGKLRLLMDSTNLAISLMNTGELYRINHTLDTALFYFEESDKIFELKNYKIGKAYNLGNIGLVYAEQGKHLLAEQNILEATKILKELGDNYPIAVYNTYMADIYWAKGDMPRALEYAHSSYNLAVADGLKEQIRDASQMLSELYESNQEYKKAFLFQEEYLAYRDSINNEETIRKMADLRTEYEVSQKQIEVDLLNQEKKTSSVTRAGLLGIILIIGGLAFIYIKRNKEKSIVNKLLTEQKQQLKIQHDELEVLNATKDRFFSIISHDLRSPVSSFRGLTSIMKLSLDEKNYDDLPKMTEMLDKSSKHLSSLLDNLLAWAVSQQGEFPYNPKKIQLKKLVDEVVQSADATAIAKQIVITNNINEKICAWVDNESVKTIIRNLVSNALKFTPKGGKVEISATTELDKVKLKILDTGVGISDEKFALLFAINELKSTPGTDGEKGLGLGLRLVYEFAKMNKGSILAESKEGKGTTFTVVLPAPKQALNAV